MSGNAKQRRKARRALTVVISEIDYDEGRITVVPLRNYRQKVVMGNVHLTDPVRYACYGLDRPPGSKPFTFKNMCLDGVE